MPSILADIGDKLSYLYGGISLGAPSSCFEMVHCSVLPVSPLSMAFVATTSLFGSHSLQYMFESIDERWLLLWTKWERAIFVLGCPVWGGLRAFGAGSFCARDFRSGNARSVPGTSGRDSCYRNVF